MMRAPTDPAPFVPSSRSLALTSALAIAVSQPLAAQSSGGGFSLPAPTPTPSAAPQGPVDERAGVPIRPRVIPQSRSTPQASTPAPSPTPTPTPTPAASQTRTTPSQPRSTPTPRPSASSTTTRTPARTPSPTPAARSTPRPSATTTRTAPPPTETLPGLTEPLNEGALGTDIPIDSGTGPGFETLPDDIIETDPVGPDDWYDVGEDDGLGASDADYAAADQFAAFEAWDSTQNRIIGGIALIVLLIGAVAGLIWRRRRREVVAQSAPNTALASGIRKSIADQMPAVLQDTPDWAKGDAKKAKAKETGQPKPQPEPKVAPEPEFGFEPPAASEPVQEPDAQHAPKPEPEPEPEAEPIAAEPAAAPAAAAVADEFPVDPAKIELSLEIVSATRSFMMFMVDFRLEIFNRSDRAVRDITVAAKLSSAQRGASNSAPIAGGQPIAGIDRIGPQQSRRISAQLQLPLSEVTPLRQGSTPLLIPLLHFTLEGNGQSAITQSFVLGTPSAAGTGRVHPLPLDGPPGGLPPLMAQAIKQAEASDAAPA